MSQSGAESHFEAAARLDRGAGAGSAGANLLVAHPLWLGYLLEILAELNVDVLGGLFEILKIKIIKQGTS